VRGKLLPTLDSDPPLLIGQHIECTVGNHTALRRNWPPTPTWRTRGQRNIPIGCWPWPAANYCTIWTGYNCLLIPTNRHGW